MKRPKIISIIILYKKRIRRGQLEDLEKIISLKDSEIKALNQKINELQDEIAAMKTDFTKQKMVKRMSFNTLIEN